MANKLSRVSIASIEKPETKSHVSATPMRRVTINRPDRSTQVNWMKSSGTAKPPKSPIQVRTIRKTTAY